MIKLVNESDMKYKTYKNAERCFDILVNEKGYSREEAQDIITNLLADYQYNPNSNQTLLSRCRQILSKDEYEAEQEFARKNNPFKRESKYRKNGRRLYEQDAEIEVKHEGILEVPDGKNVDDLPMSHFEKLAKKKGLSKITKALNNLQVWNKNDDPELSKWAGNMIDKLNKKLKKDESLKLSESYLDYDWRNTYTTRELKEMSAEKLLDLRWYNAEFTKSDLVAATDDYNNATRRPLESFFNSKRYDTWYPVQTEDGLELFMRMNGRSSSIEVVSGLRTIKYGARRINNVVRAGKVTFDSFWTKDDLFKWILGTNFCQD